MPAFIKGTGAGLKIDTSINININFSISKRSHCNAVKLSASWQDNRWLNLMTLGHVVFLPRDGKGLRQNLI
jgi:hypothetical protein